MYRRMSIDDLLAAPNVQEISNDTITEILQEPTCDVKTIYHIINNKTNLSAANIILISIKVKAMKDQPLLFGIDKRLIETQTRLPETIILDYMSLTSISITNRLGQKFLKFSYETARYILECQKNISEETLITLMQMVGGNFIDDIIRFQENVPLSIVKNYMELHTNKSGKFNLIAIKNLIRYQKYLPEEILTTLIEQTEIDHGANPTLLRMIVKEHSDLSNDILEKIISKATCDNVCDEDVLVKIIRYQQELDLSLIDDIIDRAKDAQNNLPPILLKTLIQHYPHDMMRHGYIELSEDFLEMRRELDLELGTEYNDGELPHKAEELLSSKEPLVSLYSSFLRPLIDEKRDPEEFKRHEDLIKLLRQFDRTSAEDLELPNLTSQIRTVIQSFNNQSKSYLNKMFIYYTELSQKIDAVSKGQEIGKIMTELFRGHEFTSQQSVHTETDDSNTYEEPEPPHARLPELHFRDFRRESEISLATDTVSKTASLSQRNTSDERERGSSDSYETDSSTNSSSTNSDDRSSTRSSLGSITARSGYSHAKGR